MDVPSKQKVEHGDLFEFSDVHRRGPAAQMMLPLGSGMAYQGCHHSTCCPATSSHDQDEHIPVCAEYAYCDWSQNHASRHPLHVQGMWIPRQCLFIAYPLAV